MTRTQAMALASILAVGLIGCNQSGGPDQGKQTSQGALQGMQQGGASPGAQPNGGASRSPAPPAAQSSPSGQASAPATSQAQKPSDDMVLAKVKTALSKVDGVAPDRINVSVSKGVVTLAGKVQGADQRQKIVQQVSQVEGVQSVVDHLQVG